MRFSDAALREILDKWMKWPLRFLEVHIGGNSASCVDVSFNVYDQPPMGQAQQKYWIGCIRCSPSNLKRIVDVIAGRERAAQQIEEAECVPAES
jgi:hypothetical protein